MTLLQATPPTAAPRIDQELAELRRGAIRWAEMPAAEKIDLLLACRDGVARNARRWTDAAARAKGIDGTPLAGEESISGPWAVLRALGAYVETLREIERHGRTHIDPSRVRRRPDGQTVVRVFPNDAADRILLNGITADVWMQPGVTPDSLAGTLAPYYRSQHPQPRVALVLGAGNIASIAPLDVLYKLVADGAVCVLKMNPVNDYLGPILEDALRPLVDGAFLRFAYGGADVGKYLCAHDGVDEIHITGSDATHDAIVFGPGREGADRKRGNDPVLRKPITSELGNVSPTIVVPGPWSDADIAFQAENIATQKLHNDGFNCIAAQVLVVPADWERTPALLAAVDAVLRRVGDRPAYYPGARQRRDALQAGHRAEHFGRDDDAFVARTLVFADPAASADPPLDAEAFCSLLAIVKLPGDPLEYLERAVAFANDRLWGTLGANLIVHPATQRAHAAAVDRAVANLRYGCVGVNAWTGVGFLLAQAPWGAYPGHTLADVGSGIGVVHNAHLFSKPQKTVVRAPFAPFPRSLFGYGATLLPKPPWFVTNRHQAQIGDALCAFEMSRSPLLLAKIAALAMTG
jgi:aldehyde dehydrogenase (NAD(P)+)